jgi:hypothetical protein
MVTASSHGWASAITIGLLTGAAALIAAFVVIEARSAAPLLPLAFFRNRTITAANLAGLLIGGLMVPMFFFLSLYMQQVLGYSAIKTGWRSWSSPRERSSPRAWPRAWRPRPAPGP